MPHTFGSVCVLLCSATEVSTNRSFINSHSWLPFTVPTAHSAAIGTFQKPCWVILIMPSLSVHTSSGIVRISSCKLQSSCCPLSIFLRRFLHVTFVYVDSDHRRTSFFDDLYIAFRWQCLDKACTFQKHLLLRASLEVPICGLLDLLYKELGLHLPDIPFKHHS